MRNAGRLPRSLFLPPPPDQAKSGGVLLFLYYTRPWCQEERLVRKIAPPLETREESIGRLVLRREGGLLESLRDTAEKSAAIGKIFGAAGESELGGQLIASISSSTGYMGGRGAGEHAIDKVVRFANQRNLRSSIPSDVGVQDVLATIGRGNNGRGRQSRLSRGGGRSRIENRYDVTLFLAEIVVDVPRYGRGRLQRENEGL